MASGDDLAQLLGDATFKRLGQTLASGTYKAVKQGLGGAYDEFDASPATEFFGSGLRTSVLMPKPGERIESLNLTPFVSNVGTYLKGQGANIGPVTEFALNAVLDIGNFIPLGTATKLTKAGEASAVISAVSKAGKIRGGAEIIDATKEILEIAWKARPAEKELLLAAQAGDRGALKAILSNAVRSGTLDAEQQAVIQSLNKYRDGLGEVLKMQDVIRAKPTLGAGYFLQGTRAERIALKQVEPLLKVAAPVNPFTHPGSFALQLLGVHYKDVHFFEPIPKGWMAAMDRISKPSMLFDLPSDLRFASSETAKAAFNKAADTTSGFTMLHMKAVLEPLRSVLSSPTDRLLSEMSDAAITPENAEGLYKAIHGLDKEAKVGGEAFMRFKDGLAENAASVRQQLDDRILSRQKAIVDEAVGRIGAMTDPLVASGKISQANAEAFQAHVRQFYDVFSLRSLLRDANGPGAGLAARATVGTLYAHTVASISREIIEHEVPGLALTAGRGRRQVSELIGRVVEHPELFDAATLKLKVTDEAAIKETSPLLHQLLFGQGSDGTLFEKLTTGEGFSPALADMARTYAETLKDIGSNFVENETMLLGLYSNYFPRVFTPTAKFYKEFKVRRGAEGQVWERAISDPDVAKLLLGEGEERKAFNEFFARAGQRKVTFEEARRFSEKQMLYLERMGYGEYKRDAVSLFSGYLDSANKSLLINRLVRDYPSHSPFLSTEMVKARLGDKALAGLKDETLNSLRTVERAANVPDRYKHLYVDLMPRYAGAPEAQPGLKVSTQKMAAQAFVGGEAESAAREVLASKFAGKGKVGSFRLRNEVTDAAMTAEAEWFRTGRVPKDVKYAPAVQREIESLVQKQVIEQRKATAKIIGKISPTASNRLLVFAPDAAPLQEVFRLYSRDGVDNAFIRGYERLNQATKSLVLWGDFFHFNTLAMTSIIGDPATLLKAVAQDSAALPAAIKGGFAEGIQNTLVKAALGAIGGAGVGGLLGADTWQDYATFSAAGFLYGAAIGAAMKNARSARHLAMNPEALDSLLWMGLGGWTGRPDDRSIGFAQRWLRTYARELWNGADSGKKLLIHPLEQTAHIMDGWDRTLWETLHNGAKQFYFDSRWRAELPKLMESAGWSKLDVAGQFREKRALATVIMQSANNAFGGQAYRHLFAQPEWERAARWIAISPDWSLSRLQLAAAFFGNMSPVKTALMGAGLGTMMEAADRGFDVDKMDARGLFFGAPAGYVLGRWAANVNERMLAKGAAADVYAKLARRMSGAALLGGFAVYNLMNYALNGRFMWENDEGEKLSVVMGNTGVRLTPGKVFTEAWEYASIKDKDIYPWPIASRFASKLSVPLGFGVRVASNRDWFGGPIITGKDTPWEIAGKTAALVIDTLAPLGLERAGRVTGGLLSGQVPPAQNIGRAIGDIGGFPLRGRVARPAFRLPLSSPFGPMSPSPALLGNQTLLESKL